ncbi:unnamed protein product [Rotaria magnacalcarata]|uniref:TIR domain-containing protein n=2 Tax=Rotaria magnacalcarata TaxID=392030 RepID=A0A8S2QWG2_9BILA|nr:unnamed protein product [Rotaria magnacalcarata]
MGRLYNIVVTYSRNDMKNCQRLINRLTEEYFSSEHIRSGNYYENPSCISEAKKLFVNSLGSDLYFDLEYGRLLIELPGFAALLQRRSSRVQ